MVTKSKSPTIRAAWLGQALKEIRENAGLTTRQVGDHVGKDGSTISRIENGEQPISREVLDGFLDYCGVQDAHRRADLGIIRNDAAQGGWWDGYRSDVAASLMDRAWIESKATLVRSFDITYLPGLLQLPEYAKALMSNGSAHTSEAEIDRWVEMRMQRQHVLTRHAPVKIHSLIDEQLLRRAAGDDGAMRAQLDYLAEASLRMNVVIKILPAEVCTGVSGSFELVELDRPYPEIGYVATPAGDLCIEGPALNELSRTYDRLLASALSVKESRRIILAERDKL